MAGKQMMWKYRFPEKEYIGSHATLDGRAMWYDDEKHIDLNSIPPGEFGKDWYTDADEIIINGEFVLFCYYTMKKRNHGDTVIFNDNGKVSIWRYGGGVKVTPMQDGDL